MTSDEWRLKVHKKVGPWPDVIVHPDDEMIDDMAALEREIKDLKDEIRRLQP